MNIEDIILEHNGLIINSADNIFEEWEIKCDKDHIFKIMGIDLKRGSWCQKCDKIDNILKDFSIEYEKNKKIEDLYFKYVINSDNRKFIIDDGPLTNKKFKVAQNNKYNLIIVYDYEIDNLKDKILEALKNNKESTYIGQKIDYEDKHHCSIEEIVKFINKDSRSIVKRAPLPHPNLVNKAVGYIRVSTDRQVKVGHSLAAQEALMAREAGRRNYFLKAIYIEEGISGKDIEHREALKRMMEELVEGDKVIVYAVERFARTLKDLLTLAEEIRKKKCFLIIPEMDIDFTTPQGTVMLAIRGSLAQFEREITSNRVKDTIQHLKVTGKYISKPHYGVRVNPDKSPGEPMYIRVEDEQRVITNIRLLRERYPNETITTFTRKINEAGINPPRKSKVWYHKMIKDLMFREGID